MFEYRPPKTINRIRSRRSPEEKQEILEKRRAEFKAHRTRLKEKQESENERRQSQWEEAAAPLLHILRGEAFRSWYKNETGSQWRDDHNSDPVILSVMLRGVPFQRLLGQYSTKNEIETFFSGYDGSVFKQVISAWQRRAKRLREATPQWVDWPKIRAIEAERDKRNAEKLDGAPFHVDHIVPLQGEIVCGLHIHDNMQLLPALENFKKHNSFDSS